MNKKDYCNSPIVPVSWGELFDKITILKIKMINIKDDSSLIYINRELLALTNLSNNLDNTNITSEINVLVNDLYKINLKLWDIEDNIIIKEKNQEFDNIFIELARNVYKNNDLRADLKLKINKICNSEFIEQKSYFKY